MSVCIIIAILILCTGKARVNGNAWACAAIVALWAMTIGALVFALLVLERGWP